MLLHRLFISFIAIGLGAFGGGNVAIPLIRYEIVIRYGWLSDSELAEIVTLAQMTPGPLAINAATFAGFHVMGFVGATAATLGVILPSVVIVSGVIALMNRLGDHKYMGCLRRTVRPGVLVMFVLAVWSIGQTSVVDTQTLTLSGLALSLLLMSKGKVHPVGLIVAFGLIGIMLF